MNCNDGQRKVFADEIVASVTELAKSHGLEDVIVHRDADPVLVAARGCLEGNQKVEIVVQISPDIQKADARSLIGSRVTADATADVYRAFDLSEIVAKDSVARAAEPEEDQC